MQLKKSKTRRNKKAFTESRIVAILLVLIFLALGIGAVYLLVKNIS